MASKRIGTLYVGLTSDLQKRVWQHKQGIFDGFTKKYNIKMLVCYEVHEDVYSAIAREKKLKRWKRKWKFDLIEKKNPQWKDLYDSLF